jgi:AraC family transcriptional regulator of adaptative response/methylated-DNA-[protein]-cysteine methyltransferase
METQVAVMNVAANSIPSVFPGKQWQQVLERDQRADGVFVYAVKSTKVFCRPSCPSRRPSRKNVTFFPTPAAAEAAGYRACLRCEPTRVEPKADPQAGAIAAVTDYLKQHAGERTRLEDVAKATGVGRLTILRGFKRVLGVTPGEFAKAQRVERFKEKVRTPKSTAIEAAPSESTEMESSTPSVGLRARLRAAKAVGPVAPVKITDALYEAGFGSSSRLYEGSAQTLGMKPKEMREGGEGLLIRYAIAPSPLGRMLVAATDVGVCAIAFGKNDAELERDLRERFSKAQLMPAKGNKGWLAEAVAFVASQTTEHPAAAAFPLHVRSTAFQQRVWAALRQIPRGETRSYSEVALSLGEPTKSRAVAAACAANPIAIAVPCHRVVGKDGSLTGYRWGIDRKRRLLESEGATLRA